MESLHHKLAELDPAERRIRRRVRPPASHRYRIPQSRRLRHRSAGRHGARTAWASAKKIGRAAPRNSPAAGRCASRWPSCCSKNPICCCSTSRPITSISKRATGWKQYLADYPHAFVLISHDRYFLDVTVNRIVEIWNKQVNFYTGNYEKYLSQKAERSAQLEAAYRNQRERIEQLEAFINRFRYQATKAKQVQSRIKELDKIERIEIPPDEKTIHFSFPQPKPSGRIVAEFKDVAKSYGAEARLQRRELHHRARRPHRAGGRERRGQIDADQAAGRRRAAHLGQLHAGPQRDARLFRAGPVQGARPRRAPARRSVQRRASAPRRPSCAPCSAVSCSPTTTCSSASACSPAASATATRWPACCWRRRISCCSTSPPTTWTCAPRTCCSNALSKYTGTVVFVSHDRYFIDNLATRIFEIEDGHVHVFPGNYEDYLWRKQGGPETIAASPYAEPASEPRQ